MKRDYLVNAGNRISDLHGKSAEYRQYLDETIKELHEAVTLAQSEITKLSKLRDAVDFAATKQDGRVKAPSIKAVPPISTASPPLTTEEHDDLTKAVEQELENFKTEAGNIGSAQ